MVSFGKAFAIESVTAYGIFDRDFDFGSHEWSCSNITKDLHGEFSVYTRESGLWPPQYKNIHGLAGA